MDRIEHVGVREFRDRATYYLKRGKPLAIERHGEVIGYFLPVRRRDPEEELARLVEQAPSPAGAGKKRKETAKTTKVGR